MTAMKSYLVTVIDKVTGDVQQVIVQASCTHGLQEVIEKGAAAGKLAEPTTHPVVVDVDARRAAHIPLRDTVA